MNKFNEVICLVDKSSSMSNYKEFTVSQYNNILKQYSKGRRGTLLTTFMFDEILQTICDKISIREANQLAVEGFLTEGECMYFDSLGKAIHKVADTYVQILNEIKPETVTFIVITNECDDKSKIFSFDSVRDLINHLENKYNWIFKFITPNDKLVYDFSQNGYDTFWKNKLTSK